MHSAVAGSFGSCPAISPRRIAASVTVRASGPAVSWSAVIGKIPLRLTSPTVGLMPTTPLDEPGLRIEPDVSVPIATATRLADTAIPDPELEPPGVNTGRPSPPGSGRGSYALKP